MTLYCSDADRARELVVADVLAHHLDVEELRQCSRTCDVDLAGYLGGELVALVEVKNRRRRSDEFDTVYLEVSKADRALALAERKGVLPENVYFAVRWIDQLGVISIPHAVAISNVGTAQRYDRDDPNDTDEAYLVPIRAFDVLLAEEIG